MSKEKEQEVKAEDLNLELPSSILTKEFEDDDSDMPLPETTEYKDPKQADDDRVLMPTPKFYTLFNECLGKMPYASILKNSNNDQIKLVDLKLGKIVQTFKEHTGKVCTVEKIESKKYGECLLSQGLDGKIKLWTSS